MKPMRVWVSVDETVPGERSAPVLWSDEAPAKHGTRFVEGQFGRYMCYLDSCCVPNLKPGECVECELTLTPIKEADSNG